MKLMRVYVRFFRSFNFDYERKAHPSAQPQPWEQTPRGWYPFVRLDVGSSITAVVGANESGKSHLLDAVEVLLTSKEVARQDFCRYSDLYSVEEGDRRVSDFAGLFSIETDADRELMKSLGYTGQRELHYVRAGTGVSFVSTRSSPDLRVLSADEEKRLRARFAHVFRLETEVALPVSIPIRRLASNADDALPSRSDRREILTSLPDPSATGDELTPFLSRLPNWLKPKTPAGQVSIGEDEFQLGRKLLLDVAKIDKSSFADLEAALAAEREGEVNAIIGRMNAAIAKHLNFPKWWAQDEDFQLLLSPREHEVAFTVRDRTDTEYSFNERSRGLRYFLSYYVQLRANTPPAGRSQLLLLDEPDAYLSGVGQQDLLRILENFAEPDNGHNTAQVMYVTHSPYLINRNAADRIRVLDKGSQDDGTRVVTDASQNHYEPLRSSLGPFVAETAFIGGSNLFVEGLADQVLLAGMSSHLLGAGAAPSQTLNLNHITIVPAGSASAIPYLVYLARGRDETKPPCVVLLDSDSSGEAADKQLRRNPAGRRAFINNDYIVTIANWSTNRSLALASGVALEEPEDLIALPVAAAAARAYATGVLGLDAGAAAALTPEKIASFLPDVPHVWDATVAAFTDTFADEHLEKVAFAREVVAALNTNTDDQAYRDGVAATCDNFTSLLTHLADKLRDARNAEDDKHQRDRVKRLVNNFLRDHSEGCARDLARVLFREIELALEDTDDGDARRAQLSKMRREFEIDSEPLAQVERWEQFAQQLRGLPIQERLAHQNRRADEPPPPAQTAADAPGEGPGPETNVAGGQSDGKQPTAPAAGPTDGAAPAPVTAADATVAVAPAPASPSPVPMQASAPATPPASTMSDS